MTPLGISFRALLVLFLSGCAVVSPRRVAPIAATAPAPAPTSVPVPLRSGPAVVVFFDRESSEPQIRQRLLLRSGRQGLAARGIAVWFAWRRVEDLDGQPVAAASADELRRALKAPPVGFSVMLVDPDGKVRVVGGEPMSPATLTALYDRGP